MKGGTPLEAILSRLRYEDRGDGKYQAYCPAHDDKKPSLSITEVEPGSKVLIHCQAGCDTQDILKALNLSWKDLFPGDDTSGSGENDNAEDRIEATYDYRDEDGELIYQVVRYSPKDFRQRRPTEEGRWAWNIENVRKVPYRLPELITAKQAGKIIFIVEGEKDVDNLHMIGITATTNSGGAGKWGAEHSTWLEGADVVIVPDNDKAGEKHAIKVSKSLQGIAKSIKLLRISGLPPKGDISDWIKAGGRASRLYELAAQLKVIPPEERGTFGDLLGCSDLGNAMRFVRKYGDKVKYCSEWGTWLIYDGKRWVKDRKLQIEDMAKTIPIDVHKEVVGVITPEDKVKLSKHAQRSEGAYSIKEMIKLAASDPQIAVTHELIDKDRWLLNVNNGTINLTTGEIHPHNARDMITKLAPVDYSPSASSELWQNFLNDVTGGNEEFSRFLQKAVGYSMTGDTSEDVLFFVYGPTATGKSTFLEAIKSTLGDYAKTADFESFLKHNGNNGPRDDIAMLEGARMVVSVEVDEGKRLAEGLIKQLTGRDTVACRPLYKSTIQFMPTMKLWMAANHKPKVSAEDEAMWRRIRTLPFDKTIPEDKRDPTLKAKVRNTLEVGPAILAWAVKGCLLWQKEGLKPPKKVQEATQEYRQTQDVIGEFIEDTIEFYEEETLLRAEVYNAYKQWCENHGEYPVSQTMLTQKLKERGWKEGPRGKQRCFVGVMLRKKHDEMIAHQISNFQVSTAGRDLKEIEKEICPPIDYFSDDLVRQYTKKGILRSKTERKEDKE